MKYIKTLIAVVLLTLSVQASAQFCWIASLSASLDGYTDITNEIDPNTGLRKTASAATYGVSFQARQYFGTISFSAGTGYKLMVDGIIFGDTKQAIPLFASFRWGREFFIETSVGYNIPINSSDRGILSGLYGQVAIGMGSHSDFISIGAFLNVFNLSNNKVLSYVPDGYIPIYEGMSIGLYLEIPL